MPSLGADMEAGRLVEWMVQPGDEVRRGEVVAVVETQKGAIEIEIFEAGTVKELVAGVGDEVPVGAPLAIVLAEGEVLSRDASSAVEATGAPQARQAPVPVATQANAPRPRSAARDAAGNRASPAARAHARETGVDLGQVTGTGPDGVIVFADVERAAAPQASAPRRRSSARPTDDMRKAIAAAMTRSKQTIPHVYLSHTIDLQPATDWLARRNGEAAPADRVLMGAVFVRAAALAALKSPELNGHFMDDGFRPSETVNPGVAIALRGGGLVAPALVNAPGMSLDDTMKGIRDLVTRARAGRLRSSELTHGTLTVSALGDSGVEAMAGVIFPPQVALAGIGAPQTRPWVVDGTVMPRRVVTLTVSADHRVADGRQVARFIEAFDTLLQSPEAL